MMDEKIFYFKVIEEEDKLLCEWCKKIMGEEFVEVLEENCFGIVFFGGGIWLVIINFGILKMFYKFGVFK